MYCPKCGQSNEDSALFCIGCGERLKKNTNEGLSVVSDDTMKTVNDIYAKLKDGSITVADNNNDGKLFK